MSGPRIAVQNAMKSSSSFVITGTCEINLIVVLSSLLITVAKAKEPNSFSSNTTSPVSCSKSSKSTWNNGLNNTFKSIGLLILELFDFLLEVLDNLLLHGNHVHKAVYALVLGCFVDEHIAITTK